VPVGRSWAAGSWTTALLGRRRTALLALSAGRLAWLPLALLPFVPLSVDVQRTMLVAVAALAAVFGVIGSNAQVAWLGDVVPPAIRGRWLARRAATQTLCSTVAALLAAVVLDAARPSGHADEILALLALFAAGCGLATALTVRRQHEPPRPGPRERVDLAALRAVVADPGVRRLLAYHFVWNAAVGVASAFVGLHLLQNLGAPFAIAALHSGAVATIRVLTAPLWGRALERTGSRPILIVCSAGIALIPAIWILPQPGWLWPLCVEAVISGCLWSGHALASFQLPLVVAPPERRLALLGAFAMTGGLGFATATLGAGAVATALPARMDLLGATFVPIHVLFFTSFLLRLGAAGMAHRLIEPGARSISDLAAQLKIQLGQTLPARAMSGLLALVR
jgi:MFS family permease